MEFKPWGKTPRLFRDIVITEKIDGSNSAIIIERATTDGEPNAIAHVHVDGITYTVGAQSRNRIITPGGANDNHGFAAFVEHNAEALVETLGVGRHYGEWWGQGIQKRYPVNYRVFSLFNTERYRDLFEPLRMPDGREAFLESVPVLYEGEFSEAAILGALHVLRDSGSVATPLCKNPEGIVVFHTQSRQVYKVTLDNNDKGKWEADGSVSTQD